MKVTVKEVVEMWEKNGVLPEKVRQGGITHFVERVVKNTKGEITGIRCVPVINGQRLGKKNFALNTPVEVV